MRWQDLPIVGGSYRDDTRPWSVQDTINLIPVQAEQAGTRTPALLRCAPGFSLFSAGAQLAPCRGLHNVEGTLYGVVGDKLYRWGLDGTATALGGIPGVERVSMAHNQIAGGNQIAVAANNAGYVYDTVAGTLTQITDDGFPGSIQFGYLSQSILGIDPSRNFAFWSAIADATSYNTLDRVQAEAAPDKIVGMAVTHSEWWLFGERTVQPFYINTNASAQGDAFLPMTNTVIEVGCASRDSIVNMDNSVFWLGNDGIVYRANGYQPQRISTHAIEQAIAKCNRNAAFAFTFEDRGHKVYYLTFADGETWGYDAASGEWHRRQSYEMRRWRLNDLVYWNGQWVGGDYANGNLYTLDWNVMREHAWPLERMRVSAAIADNQNPLIVNGVEIVLDTGDKSPPATPMKLTGHLPDLRSGIPQAYQYNAIHALPPTDIRVISGALPDGLSIDASGAVSGTRGAVGTYHWQIMATDAIGQVAYLNDTSTTGAVYGWTFVYGDTLSEEIAILAGPRVDGVNSLLIAGSGTQFYTSPDGKTWTPTATKLPTLNQTLSVAATTAAWFAVGNDGSNSGHLWRTKDKGITWTELKIGTTAFGRCQLGAYENAIIACSDLAPQCEVSGDNGDTWSAPTLPASWDAQDSILLSQITYVPQWNEWFVPGGAGNVFSASGLVPSAFVSEFTSADRKGGCAYSPELDTLVIGGAKAWYKQGKTGTWTQAVTPTFSGYLFEILWNPVMHVFVADLGTRSLLVSADGKTWTLQSVNMADSSTPTIVGSCSATFIPWTSQMLLMVQNSPYRPIVSNF